MKFLSTRNPELRATFEEALFTGLAPDGGLFNPAETPDLTAIFNRFSPDTSFVDIASAVTAELFKEEIDPETARNLCERAFTFSPELRFLENRLSLLELYHGPSCAFKDFGASFLATSMEHFLEKEQRTAIILTATSGDTGSAVAKAFHGKKNIYVVILYPSGRVSPLQEKQLTTVGDNVEALEVEGAFDDCQRMVKEAFNNKELRARLPLTSANSINLGRLLPQSYYYIYAWAHRPDRHLPVTFCVPSGNFGNLTAGVLAWKWGLEVERFIAATNANDVVPEYLKTREYKPRPSVRTYSNAMDVGDPSNFERLQTIFGRSWEKMHAQINEEVVTDSETLEVIREVYKQSGAFFDPHTAVGYAASNRYRHSCGEKNEQIITLSTAHPGKFLEVVEEATGARPKLPEQLAAALELPKQSTVIDNRLESLSSFLLSHYE